MTALGTSHQRAHAQRRRLRDVRPRVVASRPPPVTDRDKRRAHGWPSGRQWRKHRKAEAAEMRRLARLANSQPEDTARD